MARTSVNFLMENLRHLINFKSPLILDEKDQIEYLLEELRIVRNFVEDWEGGRFQHENLKHLLAQIRDLVSKAEDAIDLFVVDAFMKYSGTAEKLGHIVHPSLNLGDVKREIMEIKRALSGINRNGDTEVGNSSTGDSSSRTVSTSVLEEEKIVGFDEEVGRVKDLLVRGTSKRDVILITGLAGQGKTTLARSVYNDGLSIHNFHIRAWTTVSQEGQKRSLLLGILSCAIDHMGDFSGISDDELCEQLCKSLKGKTYLIVIDDIWDIGLWNEVERFLPDDNNGSRIMITTRLTDVGLDVKGNWLPQAHSLHFLTEGESWDLFQNKVSHSKILMELGKTIASRCQGLPLAILLVAGILATKKNSQDFWEQILQALNSCSVDDPQRCMDYTLSLSYDHLPHHLRPCFLYFAAFPEDFKIPVRKVIQLWVAEGFVAKIEHRNVEEVAEEYLMDLVGRNLVRVSRRRADGGFKICRVHKLLRDFCLIRAKEECFLQHLSGHRKELSGGSSLQFPEQIQFRFLTPHPHIKQVTAPVRPIANTRRLSVHANILHHICLYPDANSIRSFLCFAAGCNRLPYGHVEYVYRPFKLLRVLDICEIPMDLYPTDIEQLVLLRYLGLCVSFNYLPASISNLWNLETLVLSVFEFVTLPHTITQMVKLRHLCVSGKGLFKVETQYQVYFSLDNMQTISRLYANLFCGGFLFMTPNLKALELSLDSCILFPDLNHLNHLHELRLYSTARPSEFKWSIGPDLVKFPPNLKKLTLEKTYLSWADLSILGKLPKLEILKLLCDAVLGSEWTTKDGELAQLKYLKLQSLQIAYWNISSNHFPKLQHLVFVDCRALRELPSDIVDITTLKIIELRLCSSFSQCSARNIKEEQEKKPNNKLKIVVNRNKD